MEARIKAAIDGFSDGHSLAEVQTMLVEILDDMQGWDQLDDRHHMLVNLVRLALNNVDDMLNGHVRRYAVGYLKAALAIASE